MKRLQVRRWKKIIIYQTDRTSIVRHINNIYKAEELDRESTCAKIAQVQIEGKRSVKRTVPFFNLDMIISVGYRVNSKRGVRFRQWANRILKDYLVKGYAVNERLRKEQIGELPYAQRVWPTIPLWLSH